MLKNGGCKVLWRTKEGEFTPLGVGLHMNENFLEKVAFKLFLEDNHISPMILPFVTMWMDQESITLSELIPTKTNFICYQLYVESKKQYK